MLITKFKLSNSRFKFALICVLLVIAVGCRYDMQDQPRYEYYEKSDFFADKRASRKLPEHVVARGFLREDDFLYTGKLTNATGAQQPGTNNAQQNASSAASNSSGANASAGTTVSTTSAAQQQVGALQSDPTNVNSFPFPVTQEVLDRGQERYQIFCAMCHGVTGYGDGMVVRRGYKAPTSYHDPRLRQERVGHFFDVITNGWGSMPNYAAQVTPRDRWAIAAYIRALQLSQGTSLGDLPEAEQRQMMMREGAGAMPQQGEQREQQGGGAGEERR